MTTFPTTVDVWFGLSATPSTVFTLDDAVRGVLDATSYTLSGEIPTDVAGYTTNVSFTRGKTSPLFGSIDPASGSVTLNNETRVFDPLYTAGPYYGDFKPGKRVTVTTNGITIFDGRSREWANSYETSGRSLSRLLLEDLLGLLGRQEFDAWTTTAGELSGARVSSVLDRGEVLASASRAIGVGASTLQADNVSWGSNVLNYLQLVTDTEQGLFYCSREGVLTFVGRKDIFNSGAVAATFSDAGVLPADLPFHALEISQTGETYSTRVSVDGVGFVKATVTATNAADDGVRSTSLSGLLMDSQVQVDDLAAFLANIYSRPDPSIDSITINLNSEQYGAFVLGVQLASLVLLVDIGSIILVEFTPNGIGSAISQRLIVDGISHDIGPDSHYVTFYTSKADGRAMFQLDSAEYGILDDTVSVLGF